MKAHASWMLMIVFGAACAKGEEVQARAAETARARARDASGETRNRLEDAGARANPGGGGGVEMRELALDQVPGDLGYEGSLLQAIGWRDANGDNWVLFSEAEASHDEVGASVRIYVSHYAAGDGEARLLRLVQDRVEQCPVDITLRFDPRALSVTDLDGDGIGEVTFAYWISCKGDVSPDGLKLLVLEDGDKYIIRGSGHWADCAQLGLEGDPGCLDDKTLDRSIERGPVEFRDHALEVWARISPQTL